MLYTFPLSPSRSSHAVFTVVIGIACVRRLSSLSNKLFRVASHIISVEFHFLSLNIFIRSIRLRTDTVLVSVCVSCVARVCVCVRAMLNATTLAAMAASMATAAAAAQGSIGIQCEMHFIDAAAMRFAHKEFYYTRNERANSYLQSHHGNRLCLILRSLPLSHSLDSHTLPHAMQHGREIFTLYIHTHTHHILMDYYLHPLSAALSFTCLPTPLDSLLFVC